MSRLILFLALLLVTTSSSLDTAIFVLGGGSKIFLADQLSSPILDSFELFGCHSGPLELPRFPVEVFGPNLAWEEEQGRLVVCGGSTWDTVYSTCYSWTPG